MASRKDKQRINAGGMSLLPPGDNLNPPDSLLMDNCRVDQLGHIQSRKGSYTLAGPVGSGIFHTLKRMNNDRYAGIGTDLYYGPSMSLLMKGGFDGQPLGVAFYRGAGWIMNQSQRLRVNGPEFTKWGVPAPTSKPTSTGNGTITNILETFAGSITVEYSTLEAASTDDAAEDIDKTFTALAMDAGTPVENDQVTADFVDGQLKCLINTPCTVKIYSEGGYDTFVAGDSQDEDFFRFRVYCSDPSKISSLAISLRSGTDEFVEIRLTNPAKYLNQSLNSWTDIRVRRRLNLDNFSTNAATQAAAQTQQAVSDIEAKFAIELQTPTFQYYGGGWPQTGIGGVTPSNYPPSDAMLKLAWEAVNTISITLTVSDPVEVRVGQCDVNGAVGLNTSGSVQFYTTFVNQFNEEGNASPPSDPIVLGNESVTITGIASCADSEVSVKECRVYMVGGGLSSPVMCGKVSGNGGGSVIVTQTIRQLQADYIQMPTTHGMPPAARGCVLYMGRIVPFGGALHPSRYWWTPAGQPWYFRGADDDFEGDWEDAGGDEDEILQAISHKSALLFYKRRSVWRLIGDPDKNDPERTNANIGIVGPNAVCNAGLYDYGVAAEGVYRINMDLCEKVSFAIDPIFRGEYVRTANSEYLPPINRDAVDTVCCEVVEDRLRVSYPEVGSDTPNVVAVLHIPSGRWSRERYAVGSGGFTVMAYEGPGPGRALLGGQVNGRLQVLEADLSHHGDSGSLFTMTWQSKAWDQGLPDNYKIYTDIEIELQTGTGEQPAGALTVDAVFDNGLIVSLGTVNSTSVYINGRATFILPIRSVDGVDLGYKAKNIAIRVTGQVASEVQILNAYVHWYPEERLARTFDTGPTDLGLPERVKEVDYMEFSITGAGRSVSRFFSSDLPGHRLIHREDTTLGLPLGRNDIRFRLPAKVDGRMYRLQLGNTVNDPPFQVHQARVRMRPIGEYIDGTIGEYYESAEFSVAPGRVGELKDFTLDYEASAAGGFIQIYSDLPGTSLTVRRTLALPYQSGRGVYVFPLESAADATTDGLPAGQLFKVRIYPPGGGFVKLHGRAVFRARVIGVYFNGTNGEIWQTQPIDLTSGTAVFREICIVAETAGSMSLEFETELPGQNMQQIGQWDVNTSSSTAGRIPVFGRMPGNAKGHLVRVTLRGAYIARVFQCRVLARRLQLPGSSWQWYEIPMESTSDGWAQIQMPVRFTPDEFSWVELPVDSIE